MQNPRYRLLWAIPVALMVTGHGHGPWHVVVVVLAVGGVVLAFAAAAYPYVSRWVNRGPVRYGEGFDQW